MDTYSARIPPSGCVAENVAYETLVERIAEYTVRAAFARAEDEHVWEQEELRRRGLHALELFHGGRAVWPEREGFEAALAEATRAGDRARFERENEPDEGITARLERDLLARWREAGYLVPGLAGDMKKLFAELGADAIDCAREARDGLAAKLMRTSCLHQSPSAGCVGEGHLPNP